MGASLQNGVIIKIEAEVTLLDANVTDHKMAVLNVSVSARARASGPRPTVPSLMLTE